MQGLHGTNIFSIDVVNRGAALNAHVGAIGWNPNTFQHGNMQLVDWDAEQSSGDRIRPIYRQYYPHCDCICWVISACVTEEELHASANELHAMLNEREFLAAAMDGVDVPVLIVVNRLGDEKANHTIQQVVEAHHLDAFRDTPRCYGSYRFHVVTCTDLKSQKGQMRAGRGLSGSPRFFPGRCRLLGPIWFT